MAAISLLDFSNQTMEPTKKGLVQLVTNESIFMKRLKFVPVDGFTYEYRRQATLGGIAFRGINDSYTADTGVVNPQIESLAIFGGEVRTDRQIVNKQGDVVRANSIAAKAKKSGLFFDKYVIDGDPATDPKQFYGLNARLTGNQLITAGTNGAALALAMLDAALDAVVGGESDKFILCNKSVRRKITSLVRAGAGGNTTVAYTSEGQVRMYDGVPIEIVDEDGDEAPILAYDETTGNSAVTTSLYVIRAGSDLEGEFVQGLIGSQMVEHVQVGLIGTYFSDIVETNLGLAVFHPRSACRIKGILDA